MTTARLDPCGPARSTAAPCTRKKVRIVGEKASIEWWDEHPNQLSYEVQGEPARILERGMPYLSPNALADDRIGGGHLEGLFEAWANLYRRYAQGD